MGALVTSTDLWLGSHRRPDSIPRHQHSHGSLGWGLEGKLGGGQTGTPCMKLPGFCMFWVVNPIQKWGSTCGGCKLHVQIEGFP